MTILSIRIFLPSIISTKLPWLSFSIQENSKSTSPWFQLKQLPHVLQYHRCREQHSSNAGIISYPPSTEFIKSWYVYPVLRDSWYLKHLTIFLFYWHLCPADVEFHLLFCYFGKSELAGHHICSVYFWRGVLLIFHSLYDSVCSEA